MKRVLLAVAILMVAVGVEAGITVDSFNDNSTNVTINKTKVVNKIKNVKKVKKVTKVTEVTNVTNVTEVREKLDDPYGVGLDVKLFEFDKNSFLDSINVEARYDFNNQSVSTYGVLSLDLTRIFK